MKAADWIVSALAAMGGLSFIGTIINVIAQRRKLKAEEKKTGADAGAVLVGSAVNLVNEMQEEVKGLRDDMKTQRAELEDARAELAALRRHVGKLETLLQQKGIKPPVFSWRTPRTSKPAASEGG